jgi:hypothetical protein
VLAAVVLAGCGGNDQSDARNTVRKFVQAVNARDAGKLCDQLVTQTFVEDYDGGQRQRRAHAVQATAARSPRPAPSAAAGRPD